MNKLLVSVAFACVVSAGFGDYVLMDCVKGQNVYNSNPSRVETDFVPLCTDRIEVRVSHGWDVHEATLWSAGSIADGNGFVCKRVSKGSLRFDRGGTTGTATREEILNIAAEA